MKKFLKFNAALFSVGTLLLSLYQFKIHHRNIIENKIIKDIQLRYQGFLIKGTWIQKRNHHYLGEITILKNQHTIRHQFIANQHGEVFLIN